MDFLNHLLEVLSKAQLEKLIGYLYMFGLVGYLMSIAIRHRGDFWEAIKGGNGKLEMPEIIMAFALIVYINIAIADTFLGLVPSDGVFWSLNGIIMYTLTHRVFSPKKGGELMKEDETSVVDAIHETTKSAGLDVDKTQIDAVLDKVKDVVKQVGDNK